ncbi:MAG: hypothetical protein ABI440_01995 [Casimicrobiaceae bacterium]
MKPTLVYTDEFDALGEEFRRIRDECMRLHRNIDDSAHVLQAERKALWTQWIDLALKIDVLITHTCGACKLDDKPRSEHDRRWTTARHH